jgi:hypothetical protein
MTFFTIGFFFIMYQSYFDLHMDMYEHTSAIENTMSRAYARIRSNLHRKDYKQHFVGIDANDAEAIAKAKDVARKTVPKGYQIDQWKQICDSFDKESWKVNIYYYIDYINNCIYLFIDAYFCFSNFIDQVGTE